MDFIPRTDGVVTLYHSANVKQHKATICIDGLCTMNSIGGAGVVWSRVHVRDMLQAVHEVDQFDWAWSEWCQKQGIRIMALEHSAVAHVGMHGTWGPDSKKEKALGFSMKLLSQDQQARVAHFLGSKDPGIK